MKFKVTVAREEMTDDGWTNKLDTHEFIAARMVEGSHDAFTTFVDTNGDLVAAFQTHDIESVFTDKFEEPA